MRIVSYCDEAPVAIIDSANPSLGDAALISNAQISNTVWGLSSYINQACITLEWMAVDLVDGKPTLYQVMALCRQATSH